MRLDRPADAVGSGRPFVPGRPEQSEALKRIDSSDPALRMPPPESNITLTAAERAVLRQWVAQGAVWERHWAFAAPRADLPRGPVSGEVDRLIRRELAGAGLRPSAAADRATLLRRVTLDLTGLPPTPKQLAAFLSDDRPDAYQRVVDRLLASDACAERLAGEWMDLSRFADSHGLHADGARHVWPWRDWVIRAFAENMPYDQFVTWQLAGDLLPNPTRDQRLATAFLRHHPMTGEGGVIDEEFRWAYVFDRTETFGTAFLGLTMQCARCHDHKFDPVSQADYYRLAAYFNNLRELGMTGDDGDYGPVLDLPDQVTELRLEGLDRAIARATTDLAESPSEGPARGDSEDRLPAPIHTQPFDGMRPSAGGGEDAEPTIDGRPHSRPKLPLTFEPGVRGRAARIRGEYGWVSLGVEDFPAGHFDVASPFSVAAWIRPDSRPSGQPPTSRQIVGNGGEKNQQWRGWEFYLDPDRRLALSLTHRMPATRILVRSIEPAPLQTWSHVAVAYDGHGRAEGVRLYLNGRRLQVQVVDDQLHRSILPLSNAPGYPVDDSRPLSVGRSGRKYTGDYGIFDGLIDDLLLYDQPLTDVQLATLFAGYDRGPRPRLSARQQRDHARRTSAAWVAASRNLRLLVAERVRLMSATPVVMVAREEQVPRLTHVLARGEYDQPSQAVAPGTPPVLGASPARQDRLGLAEWLFQGANPLASRVAVNRYWQMLMGEGLVSTPHDFGLQGQSPAHQQVLDLLAVSFRESGWDLRGLLRSIVLTDTYRQQSRVMTERPAASLDPGNRLLWRSHARRLSAEALRDSALACSGLLTRAVGGPSVRPYQPAGLWEEKSTFSHTLLSYQPSHGADLYRRSLYTFVRRTSPPPSMAIFDAPNRSVCTVKRESTNTPLQALVLLNDPQFVEAARVIAEQVLGEADRPSDAIGAAFTRLTSRQAEPEELRALCQLHDDVLQEFSAAPESASALLAVGERPAVAPDAARAAAMALVVSSIMNSDAFYFRR